MGLEYIGSRKQQTGDGGAIAQFFNEHGALLVATSAERRCQVAQHPPLSQDCARQRSPQVGVGRCESQSTPISASWTTL